LIIYSVDEQLYFYKLDHPVFDNFDPLHY